MTFEEEEVNNSKFDSVDINTIFHYEKVPLLCFLCEKLGHGEGFCPIILMLKSQEVVLSWDISLRAALKRASSKVSRWLRDDN